MKISFIVTDCRDQISPNCTKTFKRFVKRGRPAVNCPACKATKVQVVTQGTAVPNMERECPCGNKFNIKPGRGRKATKCDDCRSNGTVYRLNEEGELDAIRAETLAEEQRELREQAGKDRAARLVEMMSPLIARDTKRRSLVAR